MTKRALLGIALDLVLAAGSIFYLLAPTVYTFYSEAQLSYSHVPKWFAATAPARLTARFFDPYNAAAPRAARFKRQVSCFLADEGAVRHAGCLHEIHGGQRVRGPEMLKIPSGRYVARFDFSQSDACSTGEARLQVVTVGKIGRVLADYTGRIVPGQPVELPFQLKVMDAALGAVEFRASSVDQCVLLSRIDWTTVD